MLKTRFAVWPPASGLSSAAMFLCAAAVLFCAAARAEVKLPEGIVTVQVDSAMAPPEWALKQRMLLEENTRAVLTFHERYHDKRGWLKCKARWSIVDGIDDVMENCGNWPLLYALGADQAVLDAFKKAFDGHIEQFSRKGIEYAPKWGCVYKEYVTAFDWQHHSEQYSAFNQLTVADPGDRKFAKRIKRFAGFYLNEGLPAGAEPNFDFTHRIIRSVMTGSRGALMEMEPIYWGNKWEEIGSWERMGRWTNIKGDWTENAYAATQAANAFIVSGDEKYRKWVLEYMDAWAARAAENGDIIPANVGLSGKVGEHWDGNWWGAWDGGWKLSNGMLAGAENALLLSGDAKYVDVLRRQVKALLAKAVEDKGKMYPPSQYDANGWSGKAQFGRQLVRMYLTDFREEDLKLIEDEMLLHRGEPGKFNYGTGYFYHVDDFAWLFFVLGRNPEFPQRMFQSDIERVRQRTQRVITDKSIDWERRSDHSQEFMPCSTHTLMNLACGGVGVLWDSVPVLTEVWHYDPARNRPGLPQDVGALVDSITKDEVGLQLVNLCQTEPRTVVVRMGAYGQHQCVQIIHGGKPLEVNASYFAVKLEPGCGTRLVLKVKRYANKPAAGMPWGK